jgi:hypothetical protein
VIELEDGQFKGGVVRNVNLMILVKKGVVERVGREIRDVGSVRVGS